jgi:hypothetical protein
MKHLLIITLAAVAALGQDKQTCLEYTKNGVRDCTDYEGALKVEPSIKQIVSRIHRGERITGYEVLKQLNEDGVKVGNHNIVALLRKSGCAVQGTDQLSVVIHCPKTAEKK